MNEEVTAYLEADRKRLRNLEIAMYRECFGYDLVGNGDTGKIDVYAGEYYLYSLEMV